MIIKMKTLYEIDNMSCKQSISSMSRVGTPLFSERAAVLIVLQTKQLLAHYLGSGQSTITETFAFITNFFLYKP